MARLNDDADALGSHGFVQSLCDLLGHALLQLEPVGERPDDPRDLAQPDHLSLGQISDVAGAEERQHMVLAEAVEGNALDEHHLVVVLVDHSAGDDVRRTDAVAIGQLAERSRYAARRRLQALPRRIFAQVGEQRLDQVRDWVALGELRLGHG